MLKISKSMRTTTINIIFHITSMYLIYKALIYFYLPIKEKNLNFQYLFHTYFRYTISTTVILINIFYTTLYKFKFPIFEKLKINNLKWPWEENKEKFRKNLPKIISLYFFNQAILSNIFFYLVSNHVTCSYEKSNLPNFTTFLFKILICTIIEDFFFYWTHRLLHTPLLYNKVHKLHHSIYNLIYLSYGYTHPLEFFLGNLLPVFLSVFILKNHLHFVTFVGFVILRTLGTAEGHSGYEFVYTMSHLPLPFGNDSRYHEFHHLKNMGNYGSFFRVWDSLFGTNKSYFEFREKVDGKN